MSSTAHPYVFRRFAGSLQVRIRTFQDILALRKLPEVHWVALACPTQGLNCDPAFLRHLDRDNNGRVRVHEIEEAITWMDQQLAKHEGCIPGSDELVLEHLSPAAAPLKQAAELVLNNLQAHDRTKLKLEQVRLTDKILGRNDSNGDGIISPTGIGDRTLRAMAEDMMKVFPPAIDRTGDKGIDIGIIKAFAEGRAKALPWSEKRAELSLWGEGTLEQALSLRAVAARLDEYFMQCRLVATQPDAQQQLKAEKERLIGTFGNAEALKQTLAGLPIAPPNPEGQLRWSTRHRGEAWEALERFRTAVCEKVLPNEARDGLSEAQWQRLKTEAGPILAWHDAAKEHPVLGLGAERVRAIDSEALEKLRQICEHDLKLGDVLKKVEELERLILFQRWMYTFVNNFVSMPHLYGEGHPALFDQGTLFLAGREFSFAVLVPNRAQHVAYSAETSMFTMYLEISGGKPDRKFEIAVPVTAGTSAGIFVGKRGIFRADDGQEYDATVVQVIVQPVSLFEAMTQPFTRIGKFFTSKIEKMSTDLDKNFEKNVETRAAAPAAPAAPAAQAPAAAPPANAGNMIMGGSVAFAAVSSSLAFITKIVGDNPGMIINGLIIVCALLAVPTTILAWLKLRKRNLAIVLEASGWALNDRLKLTRGLGRLFTRRRSRPKGSKLEVIDEVGRVLRLRRQHNPDEMPESPNAKVWLGFLLLLILLALSSQPVRTWCWSKIAPAKPEPAAAQPAPDAPK